MSKSIAEAKLDQKLALLNEQKRDCAREIHVAKNGGRRAYKTLSVQRLEEMILELEVRIDAVIEEQIALDRIENPEDYSTTNNGYRAAEGFILADEMRADDIEGS